jgi:hypothetical protein
MYTRMYNGNEIHLVYNLMYNRNEIHCCVLNLLPEGRLVTRDWHLLTRAIAC